MKKTRNHIDNLFYKNLDGLGELPPAHIWGDVENALDDHEAIVISKREKKNRYALMLLLFLITGSAAIFWVLTGEQESIHLQALEITPNSRDIAVAKTVNSGLAIKRKNKEATSDHNDLISGLSAGEHKNIHTPALPIAYVAKAETGSNERQDDHVWEASGIDHIPFNEEPIAFTNHNLPVAMNAPQVLPVDNSSRSINHVTTVHKARAHRLSVTAFFAPDITTRNLEQNVGNTKDEGKDEMVKTEKNGALDFTFGARVDYRLNKHFSIQSGISFSTNTIDIAEKTVYARYDKTGLLRYRFNMSSGYCFFKLKKIPAPQFAGDSARTEGSHSTLHYINIPLIVKYNFPVSRRIDLTVQAGIVARFIAWESISTTYDYFGFKERSISRQIEGLKKNYFNGVVGIGAEYALNKKVALTIFPSFNFATSSINKDAPVKAYPNTLSVATGVKFTF